MGPSSYTLSVVDRNVVMRRIHVFRRHGHDKVENNYYLRQYICDNLHVKIRVKKT